MAKEEKKKSKASGGNGNTGAVMVVGAGIAGIQAALDLAKAGLYVHLVESKPAIGGIMAQLDKTFPTNDCSMCIISPKLVECGRHYNIEIHTLTDVKEISGEPGNFSVKLEKQPRYVDMSKCTGCSDCTKVCPVAMPNDFNAGLGDWTAIYRLYPQAIPSAFGIKKLDRAPCVQACPANLSAQGYVQLIKAGKFKESLDIIMNRLPLPGVIGRVCPHPCESVCRRAEVEEPISICSLKRFVADQVDWDTLPVPEVTKNDQPVAIVGAGPSGLACGYHLALMGYKPVIFEAAAEAGGWLRYGIPEYRLPRNVLQREVDYIQRCGVEIRLNSPLGGDRTIDNLLTKDGFRAVFLGVGCQGSLKISGTRVGRRWRALGRRLSEGICHQRQFSHPGQEGTGHRRRQRLHGRGPDGPAQRRQGSEDHRLGKPGKKCRLRRGKSRKRNWRAVRSSIAGASSRSWPRAAR